VKLNDKDIAGDILSMCKHGIVEVTKAALECSNPRLRQTLRQMRDQEEQAHEQITRMAVANRWYLPSEPADHRVIGRIENYFTQGAVPYAGAPGVTGYRETGPAAHPGGWGAGYQEPTGPGYHHPTGPGYREPPPPRP
jgi:hypothetical protein